jgi:phage antirepressor YoqD-like protein
METSVFKYLGREISFRKEGDSVMVNATEMARLFDKTPKDWLRTDQSERLITALASRQKCHLTDLVKVINGGLNNGTWMHEDVALLFAQWLSPDFYLWCNDRIKELLKVGMTALPQTVEAMLANPDLIIGLATQLKEERQRAEMLANDVVQLGVKTLEQEKALEAAAPKVLFADTVTASADSILIGELAKIICQKGIEIGEKRLFAWMRNNGYLCSRPGEYYNRPAQRYIEQGLFEIKKGSVMHSNGTVLVTTTPMVTGKGQLYFVNKFLYQKK